MIISCLWYFVILNFPSHSQEGWTEQEQCVRYCYDTKSRLPVSTNPVKYPTSYFPNKILMIYLWFKIIYKYNVLAASTSRLQHLHKKMEHIHTSIRGNCSQHPQKQKPISAATATNICGNSGWCLPQKRPISAATVVSIPVKSGQYFCWKH